MKVTHCIRTKVQTKLSQFLGPSGMRVVSWVLWALSWPLCRAAVSRVLWAPSWPLCRAADSWLCSLLEYSSPAVHRLNRHILLFQDTSLCHLCQHQPIAHLGYPLTLALQTLHSPPLPGLQWSGCRLTSSKINYQQNLQLDRY